MTNRDQQGSSRRLRVLGVSVATAPLAARESLSYDAEAGLALLQSASIRGLDEAVVVSTCNRTEFYLAVSHDEEVESRWLAHVQRTRPDTRVGQGAGRLFRASGPAAARHLFRVACGLESAILGDAHIGGQLKQALGLAARAGRLGPLLEQTFQHAFFAMKRAQAETDIGRGHASLGAAVAGLVRERHGAGSRVLLVGAGVAARDIARQLAKWRAGTMAIANRTAAHATALAAQVGGRAAAWAAVDDELIAADVIITATSAATPILTRERLARVVAARPDRLPLVVDVGVPRNVEAAAGLACVTVDEIAARRDEALLRRVRAVPAVEAIVDAAVARWQRRCWAEPGETLLRAVFEGEAGTRHRLIDQIVEAGYAGPRDQLDHLVRRAWRRMLRTHARDLRAWLHDPAASAWLNGTTSSGATDVARAGEL